MGNETTAEHDKIDFTSIKRPVWFYSLESFRNDPPPWIVLVPIGKTVS